MNIVRKFTRKKEDFTCENCGFFTKGDGYTNHCPNCLYSKHVDIFPGDRLEDCGGLMEPVSVTQKSIDKIQIKHRCIKCNEESVSPVRPNDNREELFKIAKSAADRQLKELENDN